MASRLSPTSLNPDSEVGESTMDLTYLSTSTYIVEIQLRRSWICAMEIIENKPFVPKFHQISITPLFSTSESGFKKGDLPRFWSGHREAPRLFGSTAKVEIGP
jgi:hypothetical protein